MMQLASSPALQIVKQTALSEEKVTKRGKTSTVFVVVKNSPFQLTVALKNALTNFNHLTFDISLIYDMPNVNKEVSYVSTKPVDYKPSLNDVGDEICFDVKIKVLSSHHEDNFFRLRINVWDPNNDDFLQLSILSHPIKVISKPMNQRKTRKRAAPARRATTKSVSSPTNAPLTPPMVPPVVVNNVAMESSLERLDQGQQETLRLLRMILEKQEECEPPCKKQKLDSCPQFMDMKPVIERQQHQPPPQQESPYQTDFESAFSCMLQFYSAMTAEQKAERTRKLLRTLSVRDHEQLEELFDIMGTTGLKTMTQETPMPAYNLLTFSGGHSDACGEPCPHKMELAKIDQFYNEVFF